MNAAETKRWKEIGIGAVVAVVAFFIAWKVLAGGTVFGSAGGPVGLLGESGTVGDAGGSLLIAVLTFLAYVGRHAIALWAGWSAGESTDETRVARVARGEADPVEGTCAAMIFHLRAGDNDAATAAFESLAALVAVPEPPKEAKKGGGK